MSRVRDYRKIWLRELGSDLRKMLTYLQGEYGKDRDGEAFKLAVLDAADAIELCAEEARKEREEDARVVEACSRPHSAHTTCSDCHARRMRDDCDG